MNSYSMHHPIRLIFGLILIGGVLPLAHAETQAPKPEVKGEDVVLRFEINKYTLDGATLLNKQEIAQAVAPYIGKNKDFSDVERALEAIEALYAKKGFSAVHISLPEQELEKGDVHFRVVESHLGKVTVKRDKINKYVSDQNALNALPSVRPGNIPIPKQIASELKLANENPSRQLNVVLKEGENENQVDANVLVTDSKPGAWGVTFDNTGTDETGRTRLGLSYRYANLFDKDQVASVQTQVSPSHMDRVKVFSGSYKVPFYSTGDSADFSAAYSNVNSLVGGLNNFQGGGEIFGAHYNQTLDKLGQFDPKLTYGLDYRDFKQVEQTTPSVTVMYNEIVVLPASLTFSAQEKLEKADLGFNVSASANIARLGKGRSADFAQYDQVNLSNPDANYKVVRFGGNYLQAFDGDWEFRSILNGQWSSNLLIQGEQIRLGGMDGVRGFTEGSEGGDRGVRVNEEFYTPATPVWRLNTRGLAFYDAGQASTNAGANVAISSYGVGIRSAYSDYVNFRLDAARISKAGNDPQQLKGDWRIHLALSAIF